MKLADTKTVSMFYRLSCGCVVLPLEKSDLGWRVLEITRCDDDDPYIGHESLYPFDPNGEVGYRKIEDGAELEPEKRDEILSKLRQLLNDGYRYREIRRALDPSRDWKEV